MQSVLEVGHFLDMGDISFDALPLAHKGHGRLIPNRVPFNPRWRLVCEGCGCQIVIDEGEAEKIRFAAIRRSEQQIAVCCSVDGVYQPIVASVPL